MTSSRNVGLVAVGVDTTGALTQLAGAASGAAKVATWLRSQSTFGVTSFITELTDADKAKVSARQVQDAVRTLIDRGDLDLLILYFAGHGIVKSGNDEQVLLSDVQTYKDEAIAIAPTVLNAFYSTVPHVIVVSDACRNAVDPFGSLGTVAGKPALDRRAVVGARKSKVDVFYATEPSQTAKEFDGDGFFTEVLLDALTNPPASVSEVWPGLDSGVAVVPAWKLEPYLGVEVPLRAAQQTPSFDQTPDFTITSRAPQFFGYAKAAPATRSGPVTGAIAADTARRAVARQVELRSAALDEMSTVLTSFIHAPTRAALSVPRDAGLAHEVEAYVGSEQGRQAFETRTGYSVLGDIVEKALLSGGRSGDLAKTHEGSPGTDVRLYPPPFSFASNEQRGSVALFFSGGTVCILPILPGYIGTLHLRDGRAASLSFEVSAQLRDALRESADERRVFAERRALAAALSASGKLQRLAPSEGASFASFLRQSKRADPTLGIYSAYAYALSGNDEGVISVNDWFSNYPSLDPASHLPRSPVPFDVAMLAHRLSPATALRAPGIAPFCPMMTLGWSLMPSYVGETALHPAVIAAGKTRLNAEWTTFRHQDIKPMLTAFERGELQ
jgi:hypothetical protein